MKKIIISLIAVISFFQLCSCSKKDDSMPANTDNIAYIDLLYNTYDEGRIYSTGSSPMMYIDYNTMKITTLCAKPNCTHTTNECLAKIMGRTPLLMEDGIYFFRYSDGIKELKNGEREHYMNSKLCHISLDSSEVTELVEFKDCVPRDYDGVLLYNNKIYFIGDDLNPVPDEYGNIRTSNNGGKHFLCSIDLRTNKYTNYGSVYDNTLLNEIAKNDNTAILKGIYNSKMYIAYSYCDDYDNLGEDGAPIVKDLTLEFDPKTKELKQVDIPKPLNYLTGDSYIYYDNEIKKTVILTNEQEIECNVKFDGFVAFFNNKLFGDNIWYDITNGSVHNFDSEYWDYWVMDYYDGYYIMGVGAVTKKVSEEELLSWE